MALFAKRDLQFKASYTSSPLYVRMLVRINVFMCVCVCACVWDRGRRRGSEGKCVSVWEREMVCVCVCMRVCARKYVCVPGNWSCMPWLMHWCGLNDPYAWHDSFIRTESISGILSEKLNHTCDMTHYICDMTHTYVTWLFLYVTRLGHMGSINRYHLWYD